VNEIKFEQTTTVDTNVERANSFNAMPVKKGDMMGLIIMLVPAYHSIGQVNYHKQQLKLYLEDNN
jgi:hypothetical protein